MAPQKPLLLRLDEFEINRKNTWKGLQNCTEFCDVTLACEDMQFQAHKLVISSSSIFFKNILENNNDPHPFIYLRGVTHTFLKYLLDFMYQGKADVPKKEIKKFIEMAQFFKIKGLDEDQQRNIVGSKIKRTKMENSQLFNTPNGSQQKQNDGKSIDSMLNKKFENHLPALRAIKIIDSKLDEKIETEYEKQQEIMKMDVTLSEQDLNENKIDKDIETIDTARKEITLSQHKQQKYQHKKSERQQEAHSDVNLMDAKQNEISETQPQDMERTDTVQHEKFHSQHEKYKDIKIRGPMQNENYKNKQERDQCIATLDSIQDKKDQCQLLKEDLKLEKTIQLESKMGDKSEIHYEKKDDKIMDISFNKTKLERPKNEKELVQLIQQCLKKENEKLGNNILDDPKKSQKVKPSEKFSCEKCGKQYVAVHILQRHIDNEHNKIRYPCFKCSHQATLRSNLKKHIEGVHEGIKYPCPACKYKATQPSSLKTHVKLMHKGFKLVLGK